jgi:hypothetical protein
MINIRVIDFSVTVAALLLAFYGFRRRRSALPFPPGPKGLPLVGNMFGLPKSHEWKPYAKWSKELGLLALYVSFIFSHFLGSDIIHLSVAGTHIIVLNSFDAAYELLEKKSSIYSDRYGPFSFY